MTRITSKTVNPELDQGVITFYTGGTERGRFTGTTTFLDGNGIAYRGLTGGVSSITAASAATAGSTSALSSISIAHGLAATPTLFNAQPANTATGLARLLGESVAADATNITVSYAASFTASGIYSFQWFAAP